MAIIVRQNGLGWAWNCTTCDSHPGNQYATEAEADAGSLEHAESDWHLRLVPLGDLLGWRKR